MQLLFLKWEEILTWSTGQGLWQWWLCPSCGLHVRAACDWGFGRCSVPKEKIRGEVWEVMLAVKSPNYWGSPQMTGELAQANGKSAGWPHAGFMWGGGSMQRALLLPHLAAMFFQTPSGVFPRWRSHGAWPVGSGIWRAEKERHPQRESTWNGGAEVKDVTQSCHLLILPAERLSPEWEELAGRWERELGLDIRSPGP